MCVLPKAFSDPPKLTKYPEIMIMIIIMEDFFSAISIAQGALRHFTGDFGLTAFDKLLRKFWKMPSSTS